MEKTIAEIQPRKKLLTTGQMAYSTWFLMIGLVIWSASISHEYTLK
jgi:hypothetical protein